VTDCEHVHQPCKAFCHLFSFTYIYFLQSHSTRPFNCLSCPPSCKTLCSLFFLEYPGNRCGKGIHNAGTYTATYTAAHLITIKTSIHKGPLKSNCRLLTRFMGNNPLFLKWQEQVRWRRTEWHKPTKSKQTGILLSKVKLQVLCLVCLKSAS
jgi:hypothetical protein